MNSLIKIINNRNRKLKNVDELFAQHENKKINYGAIIFWIITWAILILFCIISLIVQIVIATIKYY